MSESLRERYGHWPGGQPEALQWPDVAARRAAPPEFPAVIEASGLVAGFSADMPDDPARTLPIRLQLSLKRALDVLLALGAGIILSPLLLALAVAVKVSSPGPVLFRQLRIGRNGRRFRILKFRTMYVERGDASGVSQTVAGDERVTALGRVLRRTNADELPQLFNVLVGDMSIIGPRPHPVGMLAGGMRYEELVPYYERRHVMRPGISGWAQVNGFRGPTGDPQRARARIDHDLAYIQHFSLWLDLKILLRTLRKEVLRGSGF